MKIRINRILGNILTRAIVLGVTAILLPSPARAINATSVVGRNESLLSEFFSAMNESGMAEMLSKATSISEHDLRVITIESIVKPGNQAVVARELEKSRPRRDAQIQALLANPQAKRALELLHVRDDQLVAVTMTDGRILAFVRSSGE